MIVPTLAFSPPCDAARQRDLFLGSKSLGGDVLVAFKAVLVADRVIEHGWLHGCTGVPFECIPRSQQFSLNTAKDALPRMAMDAKGILRSMK
jgi:hypothetical protein